MKGISFGQYYPADSLIHRMDPRFKILVAIVYIVGTFLCKSVISFGALLLSSFALIIVSKIPFKTVLRSVSPLLFIIGFTVVINIFFGTGEVLLVELWGIRIYAEGIWRAVFMFLRIFSLITATGIFLTYTTTPMDLTDALEALLSPLKKLHVPVHVFAMMMSITLRFIPTLTEETEKIMSAQKARGANFTTGNLFQRAKALIPILIPLFISAINRATQLADAMECRCYHGGEGRTRLNVMQCHASDFILSAAVIACCVALVLLNQINFLYVLN